MNNARSIRLGLVICIALLLTIPSGGTVFAQSGSVDAQGSPDIDLYVPNNEVTPGTETTLTVQYDNDGEFIDGNEGDREYVTTARSVITSLDADDVPITVTTGEKSVGEITESEPEAVEFDIEVPESAEPGTYELEVDIEYTYTSKARFGVANERNIQTTQSRSLSKEIEIEISDDARFRVTDVDSDLRVGEEGEITGEIANVGGEDATNVEVQFPTEHTNIEPLETSVAVGDVDAGDSVDFRLPIEVGSEAEAVTKRFDLPVSFRDENGIRITDDDPELLAEIAPERDEFAIEALNGTITSGETATMEFTVTNNRNETVSNVEPKVFTDTPFSSDNDEAFIDSLEPGESETISFDLSADGGATPKTYPVTVDVRYDDADGESRVTDSYRVAIDVVEPEESGGLPLGLIGAIVLIGASAIGLVVWIRGDRELPQLRN